MFSRYDHMDYHHLKAELEQERRNRDSVEMANADLERSVTELDSLLMELEKNSRQSDDNEWKIRFENQTAFNKQIQEQKEFLEVELTETRRRLTQGTYPDAMNFNLDALNETELLRLVKHLERMRNDFYSTLRDTEWKLDKQSKEFHHFDEMRRVYKIDLKKANTMIVKMGLSHVLDHPGPMPPLTPPPMMPRNNRSMSPPPELDFDPIAMGTMGALGKSPGTGSRNPKKDGGGGGGGGPRGRRPGKGGGGGPGSDMMGGMNQSPRRSKSRGDKRTKKRMDSSGGLSPVPFDMM